MSSPTVTWNWFEVAVPAEFVALKVICCIPSYPMSG